jgi:hypothetical protein
MAWALAQTEENIKEFSLLPHQVELGYDTTCREVCEHQHVNHSVQPKDCDTTTHLKILRHQIHECPLLCISHLVRL